MFFISLTRFLFIDHDTYQKSVKVEFFPDETAGFAEVHASQIASCDMGGGLRKVQQAETKY